MNLDEFIHTIRTRGDDCKVVCVTQKVLDVDDVIQKGDKRLNWAPYGPTWVTVDEEWVGMVHDHELGLIKRTIIE